MSETKAISMAPGMSLTDKAGMKIMLPILTRMVDSVIANDKADPAVRSMFAQMKGIDLETLEVRGVTGTQLQFVFAALDDAPDGVVLTFVSSEGKTRHLIFA